MHQNHTISVKSYQSFRVPSSLDQTQFTCSITPKGAQCTKQQIQNRTFSVRLQPKLQTHQQLVDKRPVTTGYIPKYEQQSIAPNKQLLLNHFQLQQQIQSSFKTIQQYQFQVEELKKLFGIHDIHDDSNIFAAISQAVEQFKNRIKQLDLRVQDSSEKNIELQNRQVEMEKQIQLIIEQSNVQLQQNMVLEHKYKQLDINTQCTTIQQQQYINQIQVSQYLQLQNDLKTIQKQNSQQQKQIIEYKALQEQYHMLANEHAQLEHSYKNLHENEPTKAYITEILKENCKIKTIIQQQKAEIQQLKKCNEQYQYQIDEQRLTMVNQTEIINIQKKLIENYNKFIQANHFCPIFKQLCQTYKKYVLIPLENKLQQLETNLISCDEQLSDLLKQQNRNRFIKLKE